MFEKASRLQLRFVTQLGNLSVEDLWNLPLTSKKTVSLDGIARMLNRVIKDLGEESFVSTKSSEDVVLNLKFDIVKHVIAIKLAENEASRNALEVKAKKEKIMAIMADKQDDELKSKSSDELKELLEAL
jgi:hypothetical protein